MTHKSNAIVFKPKKFWKRFNRKWNQFIGNFAGIILVFFFFSLCHFQTRFILTSIKNSIAHTEYLIECIQYLGFAIACCWWNDCTDEKKYDVYPKYACDDDKKNSGSI